MEFIKINATENSPEIILDPDKTTIKIEGTSYSPDPIETYTPVIEWIEKLDKEWKKGQTLKCILKLEFLNSSGHKTLYKILFHMQEMYKQGKDIKVEWHYESDDEDLVEMGQDFVDILKLPIEMIPFTR